MNFLCDKREIQILCMEGRNYEKLEKGEPTSRAGKKKNLGHDAAPVGRCCVTRPTRARIWAMRVQRQNHYTAKGQLPFYALYI